MIKKHVIVVSAAVVLFLCRINNVQAEPSLLTWASFAIASDLSGLAGNLENGQPANIFGGVGSGLAWAGGNSFVMSPDRGPNAITWNTNVDNTTSYISRLQNVTLDLKQTSPGVFSLTPTLNSTTLLYSSTPLDYNYYNYGATSTVVGDNYYFNGRSDNFGAGTSANTNNARFDPEAVRVSPDGRYVYLSDEYGPYVYQFDRETGLRTKTFDLASNLSVTNQSSQAAIEIASNTIGRVANKGMEGLAISPDGSTLFGFMQGPLIQDGGNGASYNRIVKINVTNGEIAQYAYNNQLGGTNPSSELLAINNNEFLVLERDNKGLGEGNAAVVKDLIKIDLSGAADVTGLSGSAALASNAVTGTVFLDIVAAMNAAGISSSNIPAKLESIAWGQDMVINGTNTHMLYMGNDNDFTASSSGPSVVYVFGVTDADLGGSTFVNQSISFQLGGDLYVGSNSTVPPVSYTSGTNFYNNVYVGYEASASNNQLVVANPGTVFSNSGTVYVGYSGSGNSLTVSNGARVDVSGSTNWLAIGENEGANGNTVTVTGSNSSLNVAGWLVVGWGSNSGNRLIIADGGSVSDSNGYIGYTNGSSGNSALVTDPNSTWSNSGDFYVGYFGDSNSLVISNGGKVIDQNGSVGFHGDGNTVQIAGTNSLWSNGASFYVGNCGSDAQLIVSNGGGVISSNGYIAEISKWSNCSAVITGNGSYWSNTGTLTIGSVANGGNNPSSGNSLVISDGGVLTDTTATIAAATNFIGNSVTVTGSNSLWSNSGDLYLGYAGSSNTLVISNGGRVDSIGGYIGHESSAVGNLVIVTGSNSSWINSGDLYVGYAGQSNRLVISNGGLVSDVNGYDDGISPTDANNSVLVSGNGSRWENSGNLTFGLGGHDNSLVVSNGGVVGVGGYSVVGDQSTASNNSVLITGPGSLLNCADTLRIGSNGAGNSMVISNRGVVQNSNYGVIGSTDSSSNNTVLVTGLDSYWNCGSDLAVGLYGSSNSLVISNEGSVTSTVCIIGFASGSSNNSVLVTGSNSVLKADSTAGYVAVGSDGAANSLIISDGGRVSDYQGGIGLHSNSLGNSVLITGANSIWTNGDVFVLGLGGSGTLSVANGGLLFASQINIGQYGTLNIGRLGTNDSAGSVAGDIVFTTTNNENFGINFNQTNSFNFSNNVSGPGWICALGAGTTIMSGSNSYSQYTKIDAGTIVTTTTNALGTGYVSLAGGSNPASLLLSNNLTISSLSSGDGCTNNLVSSASGAGSSTLTINGSGSTNYGGVISGSLSLVRSGTGTTTLTGSNSFSGPTLINGGMLAVDGTNGSSPVTVAAGGTLAGKGVVGAVTVMTGGTLSPSSGSGSPSILSMDSLDLQSGSTTTLNVLDPSQSAGTGFDRISVTHGLTFGGSLYLNVPESSGSFDLTLFDFANETANVGFALYLREGSGPSVAMTQNDNVWNTSTADGSYTFYKTTGILQHTAVPEPSVTLLLIVAGAALVVLRFIPKKQPNRQKKG